MKYSIKKMIVTILFFMISGYPMNAAAEDIKRIILMETMPVPAVLEHSRWFQVQLKELGYENGKNMDLVVLKANGDRKLAETLLSAELAKGDLDIVVTIATLASQAAVKLLKGKDIPIFFFQVSDPVGAGLVERLNAPTGSNITGKVFTVNRQAKIEMILRLVDQTNVRKPIRFGIIHSSYPSAMGDIRDFKIFEKTRNDVVIVPCEITYQKVPDGLPSMLEQVKKGIIALDGKVDFWIEPLGPLGETLEYTSLLLTHSKIPIAIGTKLDSVKMGALMHVTPNMEASGREAALLADGILKGKNPGQIPVIPPSEFDLGINLTTALNLNIVVPPDLLKMAGKNIYRSPKIP
ncbi:ABC transporter substrate binding protein [Desulfobacterales bacterium HSG16]|nr:ABC transporter substrate binding protein [Desulfobacterales bacterium HSG16]